MMKKVIDESLSGIRLDEAGRMKIWNKIQEAESSGIEGNFSSIQSYRRPLRVLVAVFLLIFALSALCIAAELPMKFMSLFEPVEETVVCDGIEMKVVSAVADDDSVMILYTLKDLEGDRISEFTSIYDFNLTEAGTLGTYPVDYDTETKTATFCMAGDNGREMKGRELTLSVTSFLEGGPMELHTTNLSLYDLLKKQSEDSGEPVFRNYNADEEDSYWNAQNQKGADLQEKFEQMDYFSVLEEGSMNMKIPGVDWVTVTNIGYRDGWLHIQVKYDSEKSEINHGYICLSDAEGNELDNAILNTPFAEGREEFIISTGDAKALENVYLSGVFTNCDSLHTGEWKTTFKVNGVETKSFVCQAETDSATINKAVLSPLGVTVYGKDNTDSSIENAGTQNDSIRIHMEDGTDIESEGFSCSGDGETGEFECKYKFSEPVDIQKVESIHIGGEEVAVP